MSISRTGHRFSKESKLHHLLEKSCSLWLLLHQLYGKELHVLNLCVVLCEHFGVWELSESSQGNFLKCIDAALSEVPNVADVDG